MITWLSDQLDRDNWLWNRNHLSKLTSHIDTLTCWYEKEDDKDNKIQ